MTLLINSYTKTTKRNETQMTKKCENQVVYEELLQPTNCHSREQCHLTEFQAWMIEKIKLRFKNLPSAENCAVGVMHLERVNMSDLMEGDSLSSRPHFNHNLIRKASRLKSKLLIWDH
jgi:hypothetical protein